MMNLSAPQVYQFPEMEGPFSAMAMLVKKLWEFRFTQLRGSQWRRAEKKKEGQVDASPTKVCSWLQKLYFGKNFNEENQV